MTATWLRECALTLTIATAGGVLFSPVPPAFRQAGWPGP